MQSLVLDSEPGGQHRHAGVPGVQGLLGKDEKVDCTYRFMWWNSKSVLEKCINIYLCTR